MSFKEHRKKAPKKLRLSVLVVSDTRFAAMAKNRDEDVSGKLIVHHAREAGHAATRFIVPDDRTKILRSVRGFAADQKIDAVILTGGTGVSKRDVTIETVGPLFEKKTPWVWRDTSQGRV